MTNLLILIFILLVIALIIIWRHFTAKQLANGDQTNMRGQTNKDLYHEHLRELEKDFAEGGIDEESFGYLKEELNRSLLLDISATEKEELAQDKATSKLWPVIISVFIFGFSGMLYSQLGSFNDFESAQTMPSDHPDVEEGQGQDRAQMMIARMKNLRQEVEQNPENSDAWFQLGQLLTNIGEYDSGFVAYGKVIEVEGPQPDVYALQAQTRFYQNKQVITDEVQALLDKALALDPNDGTSHMLIGMDHYLRQRFNEAAASWQLILDSGNGGASNEAITSAISEAKRKAQLASMPNTAPTAAPSQANEQSNQAAVDGPQLSLSVSIDQSIVNQLQSSADPTVFIYAIPSGGARMPLAAVRVSASDLPLDVVLDNSKAMRPEINLSTAENVNILAVISFAGRPGVQKGDFKGELENISVKNKQQLNLVIDTVVQ